MFLKQVYRYNKKLAIALAFLAMAQLFVFYKKGILFTPFYNYGMFSQPISIQPSYTIHTVDNLQGHHFTLQKWDKIHYTLQQYLALDANDSLYHKEIVRLFAKAKLPTPPAQNFTCNLAPAAFYTWYAASLQSLVDTIKTPLAITQKQYVWRGNSLVLTHALKQ